VVALLAAERAKSGGKPYTPAEMQALLQTLAEKNKITQLKPNTRNMMLSNGYKRVFT
jgi:hypothetical protein